MQAEDRAARVGPVKAFIVLVGVVGAIVAVALLTRQTDATSAPAPTTSIASPDYSLTNAEALARFKELDQLRLEALRTRNEGALAVVVVPASPASRRLSKSITTLRKANVLDRTREVTTSVSVVTNSSSAIRLRQEVTIHSKFVDESGKNVTSGRPTERQVIDWELRRVGSTWLIADGTVKRVRG